MNSAPGAGLLKKKKLKSLKHENWNVNVLSKPGLKVFLRSDKICLLLIKKELTKPLIHPASQILFSKTSLDC